MSKPDEIPIFVRKNQSWEQVIEALRITLRQWGGGLVADFDDEFEYLCEGNRALVMWAGRGGQVDTLIVAVVCPGGELPGELRAGFEAFPHLASVAVFFRSSDPRVRPNRALLSQMDAELKRIAKDDYFAGVVEDERSELLTFEEFAERQAERKAEALATAA